MVIIEPHIHMYSRTTDDYQAMYAAGIRACVEPSFWLGSNRRYAGSFFDYFRVILEFETVRSRRFGIDHFAAVAVNPKEAEDLKLAAEVIAIIPQFLDRPNVLGIGEIGLNRNSRNELKVFEQQVDLAARYQQLILVHTPHLEDKLKGTRLIIDALKSDRRINPARVIIDHVEEHTIQLALDAGFWAGMTLYPESKCTAARAVDMIETYGPERLWMNSACDWGVSVPLAVPRAGLEMRRRGHNAAAVDRMLHGNPLQFLAQSPKFKLARE